MSHPMIVRLQSDDPAERCAACRESVEDPSAVLLIDALGEALGDPVRAVARAAGDALVTIGRREPAVDGVLRRALRGSEPRRRFAAAVASARLTPPGPTLLPALLEALGDATGDVRWAAARLLVDMGRLQPEVLGILIGLVRAGQQPRVRRMAAFALRALSPDHLECARALVQASEDDDTSVRRAALTAMASLLDPPPAVLARLLFVLDDPSDPASRRIATVALAELGVADPSWLPAAARERLRQLAAEAGDEDLRRGAIRALARLGVPTEELDMTHVRVRPPRPPLQRVPR